MATDRYSVTGNHPENQYYPNTEIIVNQLGIKNEELLNEFEYLALTQTIEHYYDSAEKINTFDSVLLREIHQHFLGKLYPWAGKYRTVAIQKGNSTFAMPQYIPGLMDEFDRKLLQENYLKKFSLERLVHFKCELIAIHPFREGNGRTIRLFCDLLCLKNGYGRIYYPEHNEAFTDSYIKASEAAVINADCMPMYELLKQLKESP